MKVTSYVLIFVALTADLTASAFRSPGQIGMQKRSHFGRISLIPGVNEHPYRQNSCLRLASPFEGIAKIFSQDKEAEVETKPSLPDVTIDPDFKLAAIFLTGGLLLDTIPWIQLTLGPLVTLLGGLFLFQTFRLRFVFDSDSFELKSALQDADNLEDTGENIVVGGKNRWSYDSFVNWDFFPEGWIDQPQGPILVYFKETQTSKDKWSEGPGAKANSPEALANGAVPGQVHFFPAICNAKQIREEFERRGCAKISK